MCSELTHIRTDIQIVIVRHFREERLSSNTGRLAALVLSNVCIVPYGGGEPFDELSTIEAIATALAEFESPELAVPLMAAYAEFVRRADISRGRRRTFGSPG